MSIPTYSPAQARILVAVGQLQRFATRAGNLFLEERCTRAADNLLVSYDVRVDDDARHAQDEIVLAVIAPVNGEPEAIRELRLAGIDLARKAITNVKRTLRRQFARRSREIPESECHSAAEVENRLECQDLIGIATPKQREVLGLRLIGTDDTEIAARLGLTIGNVAVIAHRGANRIRDHLAARGFLEGLAA